MRTGTGRRRKCASAASARPEAVAVKPLLLIDDDPVQLRTREAVLRKAGLAVRTASTAESALALLGEAPEEIGAVITDHILPRTSGAEFVRRLRALAPALPVIVITGMAGVEEEYTALGVLFRNKPLPPEELLALVRQVLPPPPEFPRPPHPPA